MGGMTIWKRIIFGFIAVILVMIFVDSNALLNNIQIINHVNGLEHSKRIELTQSNKVAYLIQRIKSNLGELFLELDRGERPEEIAEARREVVINIPDLLTAIKTLEAATQTGYSLSEGEDEKAEELEELALINRLDTLTSEFSLGVQKIMAWQEAGNLNEAEDYFESKIEPMSREMQDSIAVLVSDAEEEVNWAINQLNIKVDKAIKLGIYLTVLSILLSLAIGLYISRSISKPLYKLIYGTREIGKGNLETTVELETDGELQLLANSFNDMAGELKVRIEAINKLNKELEESNHVKDKYFSIIAHDLKNPFSAILAFSDLLVQNYHDFDEQERRQIIHDLNVSSKVIYDLLENLLTWSRSQNGKIDLHPKNLDLNTMVADSIMSYKSNAEQKQIEITNKLPEGTSSYADEFTLMVAINNILNNAVKFTPNGGSVTISANVQPDQVELSIKDTGIGMSQEAIDRLFQSKKIESTPGTRNEKGTGLGLTLIKDFIERNRGRLSIHSTPGKGTEFRVLLPGRNG